MNFDEVFLLQGSLHHRFVRLMWHVKSVLEKHMFVSLGFVVTSKCPGMRVQFWEGGRLVDLDVLQCDRNAPMVKTHLSTIAEFLGGCIKK